jgi:uncharacterized MAPEG superfamily protein
MSQQALYISESGIFGKLNPEEEHLVDQISATLREILPAQAVLVCPLTLGGHVDNRLTRVAAERLIQSKLHAGWVICYYADYPYARTELQTLADLQRSLAWNVHAYPVSDDGLHAWQQAVAAYSSQISTFWQDLDTMRADLSTYAHQAGGVRLWQRKESWIEQAF